MGNGHFQTTVPYCIVQIVRLFLGDGILRISLINKEVEFFKRNSLKNQPKRISLSRVYKAKNEKMKK
jgi:hypothetical protein